MRPSTGQVLGQADYTAWGSVLASSGQTTPLGWQGQSGAYTDSETGLVKLGFRYYAPAIGRFLSRDPSGFSGGFNLYGYCTGDPVNVCDVSGLDEPNPVQRTLGQVAGAINAAPGRIAGGLRRGASAGFAMQPGVPTFGSAWTNGSCEANYVNGRFHTIGNAVGNGIDEINGMIGVNVVAGMLGVGGAGTTAEEMAAAELTSMRQTLGMPAAGGPDCLAVLQADGQSFFGINAHGQEIGLRVNPISRTHAEADVFNQAFVGGVRGGRGVLTVDRELCGACGRSGAVRSMARQLGFKSITIYTPENAVTHLLR